MSRETGAGRLDEGRPSATAQSVARRRASHALRDHPPVLDDPFAVAIIGAEAADKLKREVGQGDENAWDRAMRAFMAMRSRLAEDRLAVGYDAGVRQYVVLGAGLDTYGCRNARPDLKVFEIDHPSTQAWKRGRLRECGIETAPGLVFVPVDFARQALGLAAQESGGLSLDGITEPHMIVGRQLAGGEVVIEVTQLTKQLASAIVVRSVGPQPQAAVRS